MELVSVTAMCTKYLRMVKLADHRGYQKVHIVIGIVSLNTINMGWGEYGVTTFI